MNASPARTHEITRRPRGLEVIPAILAIGVCIGACGLMLIGVVRALTATGGGELPTSDGWVGTLASTIGVSLLIGTLATLAALGPAWAMRRLKPRMIGLVCAPLLLPTYLVYAAWNLFRAPGSAIGDRLAEMPMLDGIVGDGIAVGGLALWAWPLAAILIGSQARRIDESVLDALRMAEVGRLRRLAVVFGLLRTSIIGSIGLITLMMLGSAVPLHVAQVETYSIRIWRMLDESGGGPAAWRAAMPLLAVGVLGGWIVSSRLLRLSETTASSDATGPNRMSRPAAATMGIVWCLSVLVPLVLFVVSIREASSLVRFWPTVGPALKDSLVVACVVSSIGLMITAGTAIGLSSPRGSWLRRLSAWSLRCWLIGALIPGVLVGQALVHTGALDGFRWLIDTSAGVGVAHLLRFGAVAAIVGWWIAWAEPQALRDARQLFGGTRWRAWLATSGRLEAGAIAGGAIAIGLLSLHEIESAVMLMPPGEDMLSRRVLSMLHFLRDEELTATAIYLLVGGILCAGAAGAVAGRTAEMMNPST